MGKGLEVRGMSGEVARSLISHPQRFVLYPKGTEGLLKAVSLLCGLIVTCWKCGRYKGALLHRDSGPGIS